MVGPHYGSASKFSANVQISMTRLCSFLFASHMDSMCIYSYISSNKSIVIPTTALIEFLMMDIDAHLHSRLILTSYPEVLPGWPTTNQSNLGPPDWLIA